MEIKLVKLTDAERAIYEREFPTCTPLLKSAPDQDEPMEGKDQSVNDQGEPTEGKTEPSKDGGEPMEATDEPAKDQDEPMEGVDGPVEDRDKPPDGEDGHAKDQDMPAEGEDESWRVTWMLQRIRHFTSDPGHLIKGFSCEETGQDMSEPPVQRFCSGCQALLRDPQKAPVSPEALRRERRSADTSRTSSVWPCVLQKLRRRGGKEGWQGSVPN